MKHHLQAVLAAILAASAPGAAIAQAPAAVQPNAAKLAEAHAIIEIMFPPAERQRTFDRLLTQLSGQFRSAMPSIALTDPGVKAIVDKYFKMSLDQERPIIARHMPEIFEATALAYTHEFSLAELKGIHSFAMTPTGEHYLSRSAAIMTDPVVAKVNSAMIADSQRVALALMPQLRDELVAYLKAHPELIDKIKAAEDQKG